MRAVIQRYEAFLRIDETLSLADQTRARIILLTGYVFVLIQVFNMAAMLVMYEGFDKQHMIALGACAVFITLSNALRFTKSAWFYGLAYAGLAVAAVGYSATLGSSINQATGIDTPLIAILVAATALICYVGNRATVFIYVGGATLLLIGLYKYSVGFGLDANAVIFAQQRMLQGLFAIIIVGIVTLFTSQVVYRTLDEMEAALNRATEAEDARSGLMAMMTHEIRTPLNGIVAMTDLLTRNPSLDDDAKASVDLVQLSSNALMDIVNRALDRSKNEAKQMIIDAKPFDPAQLINETAELFRASAQSRGLWIGTHGTDTLPDTVVGDAGQLRQVLSNLIGNALKFTNTGGVRLGVKAGAAHPGGADILFFVQDTGVGIAASEQEKIFARFEQSASGASAADKGTGLGLPISRDLVKAMGGNLAVRSEPGNGAVFYFNLRMPTGRATETAQAA